MTISKDIGKVQELVEQMISDRAGRSVNELVRIEALQRVSVMIEANNLTCHILNDVEKI